MHGSDDARLEREVVRIEHGLLERGRDHDGRFRQFQGALHLVWMRESFEKRGERGRGRGDCTCWMRSSASNAKSMVKILSA